jgi:hypothetical protein
MFGQQTEDHTFVRGSSVELDAGPGEPTHWADRSPSTPEAGTIIHESPWSDSPHLWDDEDWETVRQ